MDSKLVYRGLRQVSDWALRFYSDIYVDGQENVPPDGPLIMCVLLLHISSPTVMYTVLERDENAFADLRLLELRAITTRFWT